MKTSQRVISLLMVSLGLSAGVLLTSTVEPDAAKRVEASVQALHHSGDHQGALRELSRWLELYPNEPLVRAHLYLAMSTIAEDAKATARAGELRAVALAIDPSLSQRVELPAGERTAVILAAAVKSTEALKEVRAREQRPSAAAGLSAYVFPPAPVGAPGYQPSGDQPMPGFHALEGTAAPREQTPAAVPPAAAPAGPPSPPPLQQPQAQGYLPPADPYVAPRSYKLLTVDGETPTLPQRVVYDRSVLGSLAFFADACGALLQVNGQNLTFTPACGPAPRVIPASEILEIAMNSLVGANKGGFHIATRKGLYLNLILESGSTGDTQALIEKLRARLSLP